MFTTRAPALVIEFYPYHPIANNDNWRITGLLGWVAVLLDQRSYDALTSSAAGNGLRTDGLMVESEGDLTPDNAKYLTASIALRLIMERHPAKNLLFSNQELPVLPSYQDQTTRQNNIDPVYRQASVSNKTHLPAIKPVREATPPVAASSSGVRSFLLYRNLVQLVRDCFSSEIYACNLHFKLKPSSRTFEKKVNKHFSILSK